jgi:F-box-like
MSISGISQTSELGEDVLLMIFQYLEGEDLLNCEAVSRQWRNSLLAGTTWKKLFHRKKDRSTLWRGAQKKLEKNQLSLRTDQYRGVCKEILQVKRNWRTGKCTKLTHPVHENSSGLTMSDDFVAWQLYCVQRRCVFLDPESLEIKEIPLPGRCEHFNELLLIWRDVDSGTLEIVDPDNRWVVNVVNEFSVDCMSPGCYNVIFGNKLLVYHNFCDLDNLEQISVWKIGNPPILLNYRINRDRELEILIVDERFIVASQFDDSYTSKFVTLHFTCPETLKKHRSLSLVRNCGYTYNRGTFFQHRVKGIIRILDVATGKHFNDVRMPFREEDKRIITFSSTWASSNSNVIVIGWKYSTKFGTCSHLSVYDLEAVKKPNSDPGCHLLYTLQFQFDIDRFVMDETRLAFMGNDGKNNRSVTVLKFVNFNFYERKSSNLKENPEDSEHVKMKVILGPYVDCDP